MANTYLARVEQLPLAVNYEFPITAITGNPYLNHVAQLALFNDGTGTVEVKRLRVAPLSTQNANLPVNISVSRITVQPVNGTLLTAIKPDSATSNLPAQVEIRKYPDAAVGSRFMQVNLAVKQNMARANQAICIRSFGNSGQVALSGGVIRNFRQDLAGTSQPIVLNEGQGLNIQAEGQFYTAAYNVILEFYTSDGSYMLSEAVYPIAVNSILTIWNGVGSGRIINVKTVTLCELQEDTLPYFGIEKICGIQPQMGTTITPVKIDSSNPDAAGVVVQSYCLVDLAGANTGAIIVNAALRKMTRQVFGVGLTQTDVSFGRDARELQFTETPLVLTRGTGIAVIQKNFGGVGLHEIEILYTHTPAAVGGASEHAYGGAS